MYVLDTNVVSELRRTKPHGAVLAWLDSVPDTNLYISAVTVGEIQSGAESVRRQDPTKAAEIELWLDQVVASFDILPMDATAFRRWVALMRGRAPDLTQDAMIAATAIMRGFTIATRNTRDFEIFEVRLLNPFKTAGQGR